MVMGKERAQSGRHLHSPRSGERAISLGIYLLKFHEEAHTVHPVNTGLVQSFVSFLENFNILKLEFRCRTPLYSLLSSTPASPHTYSSQLVSLNFSLRKHGAFPFFYPKCHPFLSPPPPIPFSTKEREIWHECNPNHSCPPWGAKGDVPFKEVTKK